MRRIKNLGEGILGKGGRRKIFQSYKFVTIIRVIKLLNGNSKWSGTEKKQRKEGKRNSENYCLKSVTPNSESDTPNSKSIPPNLIEE